MESIYKLSGRAAEAATHYNAVQEQFEALMEENGGELNEESQELIDILAELDVIKAQIADDITRFPDEYAAWFKNEEAAKKVEEAQLKAFKEVQKIALAKFEAKVKRREARMEWIKQNISDAMALAQVDKFDKKSRPDALFSLYFQETCSVEVDMAAATAGYQEVIATANSVLPVGYSLELKADKSLLKKSETLPVGAERKINRTLQIR